MNAIKVNESTFDMEVLQSSIPVLVDFAAEWCGPCKMMSPILDEIASEMDGKLKVVKIDVDEAQQLAANYNVMSIPNMLLFKNGEVTDQLVGAMAKEQLLKQITPLLS